MHRLCLWHFARFDLSLPWAIFEQQWNCFVGHGCGCAASGDGVGVNKRELSGSMPPSGVVCGILLGASQEALWGPCTMIHSGLRHRLSSQMIICFMTPSSTFLDLLSPAPLPSVPHRDALRVANTSAPYMLRGRIFYTPPTPKVPF